MIHCCILLDFICELYYDARIHEHQVSVIFVRFGRNLNFPYTFSKSIQILNFMKIRPAEAEFLHTDGGSDGRNDDANSQFSQFCERA